MEKEQLDALKILELLSPDNGKTLKEFILDLEHTVRVTHNRIDAMSDRVNRLEHYQHEVQKANRKTDREDMDRHYNQRHMRGGPNDR
jgi:hypothetical protein